MKNVVLLGSTGSIGTQALEVIAANPDRFEVVGLAATVVVTAYVTRLARQALRQAVPDANMEGAAHA